DQQITVPAKNGAADIGAMFDANTKDGNAPQEPKALSPSQQQANAAADTARAKQAFGSAQPTAAPNNRYDNAPQSARSAGSPSAVNPFGSGPMAGPSAPPSSPLPTGSNSGLIQPLRSQPDDLGGPLRDSQPPAGAARPASNNGYTSRPTGRDL